MPTLEEIEAAENKRLEPYFAAIGHLCHVWADLEVSVNRAFGMIAKMPDVPATYGLINLIDFRDQLKVIKMGVIAHDFAQEEAEAIIKSVNYIDNELRERRNRFVHDEWVFHEDRKTATRIKRAPQILRTQSRQPLTFRSYEFTDTEAKDIHDLIDEIRKESTNLLTRSYCASRAGEEDKLNPPPTLPPRRYAHPPKEKPRPKDSGRAKRKRPPQSSPE